MASLLFACKEQRSLAIPAALPSTSAGAAQEVSSSAAIPDARIAKAIDESFARDPALASRGLHVSVSSGEVTLDGTVPSLAEKWRAARLVGTFKGVTALTNGVVVRPPARPDEDVAKAVKEALELDPATRNATVDATSSAGTVTIRGSATSDLQRELLAEVASRVPGVREVDTLGVAVSRGVIPDDAAVAGDVSERLRTTRSWTERASS